MPRFKISSEQVKDAVEALDNALTKIYQTDPKEEAGIFGEVFDQFMDIEPKLAIYYGNITNQITEELIPKLGDRPSTPSHQDILSFIEGEDKANKVLNPLKRKIRAFALLDARQKLGWNENVMNYIKVQYNSINAPAEIYTTKEMGLDSARTDSESESSEFNSENLSSDNKLQDLNEFLIVAKKRLHLQNSQPKRVQTGYENHPINQISKVLASFSEDYQNQFLSSLNELYELQNPPSQIDINTFINKGQNDTERRIRALALAQTAYEMGWDKPTQDSIGQAFYRIGHEYMRASLERGASTTAVANFVVTGQNIRSK
ncbi:MAG: hypothetical protein SFT91_05040 [Rickettsiaceae bacterium]|nr:hypothetical protein [Rickettsiaceae bacterium]